MTLGRSSAGNRRMPETAPPVPVSRLSAFLYFPARVPEVSHGGGSAALAGDHPPLCGSDFRRSSEFAAGSCLGRVVRCTVLSNRPPASCWRGSCLDLPSNPIPTMKSKLAPSCPPSPPFGCPRHANSPSHHGNHRPPYAAGTTATFAPKSSEPARRSPHHQYRADGRFILDPYLPYQPVGRWYLNGRRLTETVPGGVP